jgi:hypothetical protein
MYRMYRLQIKWVVLEKKRIQRSGFDSLRYQIFWEVLGLERGPLSLVSTTEELLERKSSGSGLENGDQPRWLRDTPIPQNVGTNFVHKRRSLGLLVSWPLAAPFYRINISIFQSHMIPHPKELFYADWPNWSVHMNTDTVGDIGTCDTTTASQIS